MQKKKTGKESRNIFVRMHPLMRILISFIFVLITFLFFPKHDNALMMAITLWDVFAFTYVLTSWIVLLTRTVPQIREVASSDDGSKIIVFVLVIVSSFASMLTVFLLIISDEASNDAAFLPAVIMGVALSWIMVHTVFTFHYAHMYYDDAHDDDKRTAEGLVFPEETKPDYLDFAYFAFVIGCTFQVSDVSITSRSIRRLAFLHGLLSFALNTFVVALTINLIAGMRNG